MMRGSFHNAKRMESRLTCGPATTLVLSALLLSGCASFSPDGGMIDVANFADGTIHKDVVSIRTEADAQRASAAVQRLLGRGLTVDTAVQVALLSNRGLQASYNELALAEADRVGESLPPNPNFSISRIAGNGALEIERQVVGDILALATLPFRSDIARRRFQKAQLRAAEETLRLAADVRRAYYRAVTANELVVLLTDAKSTAESTAQLAQKLGQTGALNKLDQAREQVFYAETTADLNSYGFRPARSTADAGEQCFNCLAKEKSAKWVLVSRHASNVGYSLDSLMRASPVVNCQLIRALS